MAFDRPSRWKPGVGRSDGAFICAAQTLKVKAKQTLNVVSKGFSPEMAILPNARQAWIQGD